jgi:HEPN domain-containing protein
MNKTMVDIAKQIAHWRIGAEEDWSVGQDLISRGSIRHGLFFAHLAVEKLLKAHVCRTSGALAPPIHNLVRLAEKAGVTLSGEQIDLLAEINGLNIEGRYPQHPVPPPSIGEAAEYMARIDKVLQCLNLQF